MEGQEKEPSVNKEYFKYICPKCHYRFSRKKGSPIALRCPYCGSQDLEEDNVDINQMIKESSEF